MSLPNNTLILTKEPFAGFMPADLRAWLQDHNKDADLATALTEVSNHTGRLGHELDEVNDCWLIYAHDEWWELEKELYNLIISSMRQANLRGEENYDLERGGLYNIVKPFMEKNGFADGSGWWLPRESAKRGVCNGIT